MDLHIHHLALETIQEARPRQAPRRQRNPKNPRRPSSCLPIRPLSPARRNPESASYPASITRWIIKTRINIIRIRTGTRTRKRVPPPVRSSFMSAVALLPNLGLAMRCSPDRFFPSIVLWTHPNTRSDTVAKPPSRHQRIELNVMTDMDPSFTSTMNGMLIYFTPLVSNFL
ncbi:hypothetical protein BGY98DRAFT_973717 [Russula aff. rugulosa BPL654]|nr:hypothetical protein BGY98DRAFT_973717 [Russula aff. rugulosa BPL654]